MIKILRATLGIALVLLSIMQSKAQLLKYTSSDSIGDKPKFEGSLMGRLKFNGVYDIKGDLHGNSAFLIHKNSMQGSDRPGLWLDMRQSQLRFDGTQRLKNGKEIFARVEADFEGGPDNRSTFRLRHAYLKYDKWVVGQTWSTFGDVDMWPASLFDWDGPTGLARSRKPIIQYTIDYSSRFVSEVAAELMEPRRLYDYTLPDVDNSIHYEPRRLPDFVGTLKYKFDPGFVKVAGIYRHIDYGYGEEHKVANGYGFSAMFKSMLGPQQKNQFLLQFNYGKGIADNILPIGGSKLDGHVSNEDMSKLNLLPVMAGMISYQQFWTPKLHSLFLFSFNDFDSKKASFDWNKMTNLYAGTNLMYNILPNLTTGAEFLWGRKTLEYENLTEHAVASRVNFGFLYNF